jgi:hypothetical protein
VENYSAMGAFMQDSGLTTPAHVGIVARVGRPQSGRSRRVRQKGQPIDQGGSLHEAGRQSRDDTDRCVPHAGPNSHVVHLQEGRSPVDPPACLRHDPFQVLLTKPLTIANGIASTSSLARNLLGCN